MSQTQLHIPILYGTYANLTKLDLSFINGRIVRHKGKLFRNCIKSLLDPTAFDEDYPNMILDHENKHLYEGDKIWKYAIIPVDIKKLFEFDNLYHFYQLILSIFPSDFTIIEVIQLEFNANRYRMRGKSYTKFISSGEGTFDNYMFIAPQEYKFVKNYIKKYFFTALSLRYVKYILGVYSNSLREENLIYQYLSLVICLEVTVDGKEQLTYRLKRNIALLCGKSLNSCEIIYSNINQLYKLRSAIVHGDIKPSYKNFKEYNEYLKTLVARLIRELVVHNIPTIEELNEKITALGYGQNKLLSKNYKIYKYPIIDNIRLACKTIQKY